MIDFFKENPLFAFLIVAAVMSMTAAVASQAIEAYVKTYTTGRCECPEPTQKAEEKR